MNKFTRLLCLNLAFCASAYSQSQVDISGLMASTVRYSTNTNSAGDSKIALGASPNGFGILRIKGLEDLGDNWSAHFKLESSFQTNNGAQTTLPNSSTTGLFGREASVGLKIGASSIDAGRLQAVGTAVEPLVLADPTNGRGYYAETLWPQVFTGGRFSNAIRYRYLNNGIKASLMHAFGGQPGSLSARSMNAVTLGYSANIFQSLMAMQVAKDAKGNTDSTLTLGGLVHLDRTILHAAYMHSDADKGFSGIPSTGLVSPLSALMSAQTMDFYLIGITYRATDVITLKSAYYTGISHGGSFLPSLESGKIRSGYGIAEYMLSKKTKLIASVDNNDWAGGYAGFWGSSAEQGTGIKFANGKNTRMNMSIGVEYLF